MSYGIRMYDDLSKSAPHPPMSTLNRYTFDVLRHRQPAMRWDSLRDVSFAWIHFMTVAFVRYSLQSYLNMTQVHCSSICIGDVTLYYSQEKSQIPPPTCVQLSKAWPWSRPQNPPETMSCLVEQTSDKWHTVIILGQSTQGAILTFLLTWRERLKLTW